MHAMRHGAMTRQAGGGSGPTSMITMIQWEEDVSQDGEEKGAKAQNMKELFRRADLDG